MGAAPCRSVRVLVSGAGGFVGAHIDAELERSGHHRIDLPAEEIPRRAWREDIDAVIHLTPGDVRSALDVAHLTRVRRFVLLSTLGADAPRPHFRSRAHAEELVRAGGLPWVILRPEILWGPGDVFTNELARLLRHLPFVPIPKAGPLLEPVYAGDAARALVGMATGGPERVGHEWALVGPERLSYGEIVERVAHALGLSGRRRVRTSAWMVRMGAALEERIARRPRVTRALLDRLVAHRHVPDVPPDQSRAAMSVDALRAYLTLTRSPAGQLASVNHSSLP